MAYKYSNSNYKKEHMARAVGRALPISTKASIEICNSLRKKNLANAKRILNDVMRFEKPMKFTRFTNGLGHEKGMASGRYPIKAASEILGLIESCEANAQFKGLNTSSLTISSITAQNAGNVWRYGRHRRRKMKRTHIEVVLEESKQEKRKTKDIENSPVKQEKPVKSKPPAKASTKEGKK